MGGSGGHSDTAAGAKLALVTTKLVGGGFPKIVERVTAVTTPGHSIDAVVTEAGVAVNPSRSDLRNELIAKDFRIIAIEDLAHLASEKAMETSKRSERLLRQPVAIIEYRDGRVIDLVRRLSAGL
jgi:citrate lyase subunit alpha/citrate CoA-transferase